MTIKQLQAQIAEMSKMLTKLTSPTKALPKTAPKSVPVKKTVAPAKKTVVAAKVPAKVDNGLDVRRSDNENRVRLYPKDFNARGQVSINGKIWNQQSDGKGRFAGSFVGAESGDEVLMTRVKLGVYTVAAKKGRAVKAAPVKKPIIKVAPVKTSPKKPIVKKAMKKSASVSSKSRTAKLEIVAKKGRASKAAPVVNFAEKMRLAKLAKQAERDAANVPVKMKSSAKLAADNSANESFNARRAKRLAIAEGTNKPKAGKIALPKMTKAENALLEEFGTSANLKGLRKPKSTTTKVKIVPQVKRSIEETRGTSAEWKAELKSFRALVAANKAKGLDRLAIVPNCPYLPTDGRRYLKGGKKEISQISAFNRAATKAGFFGTEGLSIAGQLLLTK